MQLTLGQARLLQAVPGKQKPALVLRTDVANVYGNPLDTHIFSHHVPNAIEEAVRLDAVAVCVNLLQLPGRPEIREASIRSIMALRADATRYGHAADDRAARDAGQRRGGRRVHGRRRHRQDHHPGAPGPRARRRPDQGRPDRRHRATTTGSSRSPGTCPSWSAAGDASTTAPCWSAPRPCWSRARAASSTAATSSSTRTRPASPAALMAVLHDGAERRRRARAGRGEHERREQGREQLVNVASSAAG